MLARECDDDERSGGGGCRVCRVREKGWGLGLMFGKVGDEAVVRPTFAACTLCRPSYVRRGVTGRQYFVTRKLKKKSSTLRQLLCYPTSKIESRYPYRIETFLWCAIQINYILKNQYNNIVISAVFSEPAKRNS